jgi:chromosome transmission fidelity protein 1
MCILGDDRCVLMVGMPFPNPTDPELCERMRFMDNCAASIPAASTASMPAGDPHLTNL